MHGAVCVCGEKYVQMAHTELKRELHVHGLVRGGK